VAHGVLNSSLHIYDRKTLPATAAPTETVMLHGGVPASVVLYGGVDGALFLGTSLLP
jgi:hypothetical protein